MRLFTFTRSPRAWDLTIHLPGWPDRFLQIAYYWPTPRPKRLLDDPRHPW